MAIEPYKDSMKMGESHARWNYGQKDWDEGEVVTKYGIISVYMQGDDDHFHHTRLDMVVDGRLHIWSFEKRYTRRGAVMKANQMGRSLS